MDYTNTPARATTSSSTAATAAATATAATKKCRIYRVCIQLSTLIIQPGTITLRSLCNSLKTYQNTSTLPLNCMRCEMVSKWYTHTHSHQYRHRPIPNPLSTRRLCTTFITIMWKMQWYRARHVQRSGNVYCLNVVVVVVVMVAVRVIHSLCNMSFALFLNCNAKQTWNNTSASHTELWKRHKISSERARAKKERRSTTALQWRRQRNNSLGLSLFLKITDLHIILSNGNSSIFHVLWTDVNKFVKSI